MPNAMTARQMLRELMDKDDSRALDGDEKDVQPSRSRYRKERP